MLRIGLTGGIASGKSLVASRLVEAGALLIDADALAREVVSSGSPGLAAVVDRFGDQVLAADGTLDRPLLGRWVFEDEGARRDLEAIIHPLVRQAADAAEATAAPGAVVVHDIPLLVEKGYAPRFHAVLVTFADIEERVRRMTTVRGMDEAGARARIGAQADDEARRRVADIALPPEQTVEERLAAVDELWANRLQPWAANICAGRGVRRARGASPVPHDPRWRDAAARQAHRLRHAVDRARLEHQVLGLDHIGPTAVPGVPAVPVIELQLRVRSAEAAADRRLDAALREAGLVPEVDPAVGDAVFVGTDPAQAYLLHVREHVGDAARQALLSRDCQRAHGGAVPDAEGMLAWAQRSGWRGPGPG